MFFRQLVVGDGQARPRVRPPAGDIFSDEKRERQSVC
jgi:hypothetical protein